MMPFKGRQRDWQDTSPFVHLVSGHADLKLDFELPPDAPVEAELNELQGLNRFYRLVKALISCDAASRQIR